MGFKLDYDKMLLLDAEDLAEGGILRAYQSVQNALTQYGVEPGQVEEFVDNNKPSYSVRCGDQEYLIYSPALPDDEGQSWGRAAHAFFKIINDQLSKSEYRLYAINGGNDLGGMFLTRMECEAAQKSLPRKEDWPYLPTLDPRGMASITVRSGQDKIGHLPQAYPLLAIFLCFTTVKGTGLSEGHSKTL